MIVASTNSGVAVVEMLIAKGAELNAKDTNDVTALISAGGHGRADNVALLLARGADVNAANALGKTALMLATQQKYDEVIAVFEQHATGSIENEHREL